jgi:hypothetical protein
MALFDHRVRTGTWVAAARPCAMKQFGQVVIETADEQANKRRAVPAIGDAWRTVRCLLAGVDHECTPGDDSVRFTLLVVGVVAGQPCVPLGADAGFYSVP